MCGIVVYFGDAPNRINRILTGMWAIMYRAPDSTGLAVFGDEQEGITTRKAVGSVLQFLDILQADPVYPAVETELSQLLLPPGTGPEGFVQAQQALLGYEGLAKDDTQDAQTQASTAPAWSAMLDQKHQISIEPGQIGRDGRPTVWRVRSPKDLSQCLETLVDDFDLPPLAVRSLIRNSLQQILENREKPDSLPVTPEDVLAEFDVVFESVSEHEKTPRPMRLNYGWGGRDPFARKYLWQSLNKASIAISPDLDRDGVRNLFRFLDADVMSRTGSRPGLTPEIQTIFHNYWHTVGAGRPGTHWKHLYRAEKALNVYGLAAASVLTWLQREAYLPALSGEAQQQTSLPPGHVPGKTHPVFLNCFSQPVMAHGRWALQSEVNVKNTHPFTDAARQRCVAVNGQFSSDVEARIKLYLQRVAGIVLESDNSTEYLAQLWGHYQAVFEDEQYRNRVIRNQVLLALDDLAVGSQALDYSVHHQLQGKSRAELDRLAFIRALKVMSREGGQVAAVGMNASFPNVLYVGAHNRPVFIVQRPETAEYMVVSDINAALGLFPQTLIQQKARELRTSMSADSPQNAASVHESILDTFRVKVYPLEGEELFAEISPSVHEQGVKRELRITDFEGEPALQIEPFWTRLSPVQIKKDRDKTFYESHLYEIPERLSQILQTYLPEDSPEALPKFELNDRLLSRRFGRDLSKLRRIFLIGMGSTYNMAAIAKNLFQEVLPELTIVVLSPVEIDEVGKTVNADHDLAVLLSWSGTTADMVRLARRLLRNQVVCLGITEKPFADLGLLMRKSGGLIAVLSGEEVTISAVKSSPCLLLCLDLLALSLAGRLGSAPEARGILTAMRHLPDQLEDCMKSESLHARCKDMAAAYGRSQCHVIIDDVHASGTGPEIAMKLEENSWRSMGKTFDYRDVELNLFRSWSQDNPILINITNHSRSREAWQVVQELEARHLPWLVSTCLPPAEHPALEQTESRIAFIPQTIPLLQPFLDLLFAFWLGFYFGQAHGRQAGDLPRNRAKSVTVTRGRFGRQPTVFSETRKLEHKNAVWSEGLGRSELENRLARISLWEQRAQNAWERDYYKDLRGIGLVLAGDKPLLALLSELPADFSRLAELIMKQLPVDGEIILIPLDRGADATARNAAKQWSPFLGCPIRVDSPGAKIPAFPEETLVCVLASKVPEDRVLESILSKVPEHFLWFGPAIQPLFAEKFQASLGCYQLLMGQSACEHLLLYAGLSLFLIRIWEDSDPHKASIMKEHFQLSGQVIDTVLNAGELQESIQETSRKNAGYQTGLLIGPASGNGVAWVGRFDHCGSRVLEWYQFGSCAHGPVVTVDDQVEAKFIALDHRSDLVARAGEETVKAWEARYLSGESVDRFLAQPHEFEQQAIVSPFFARGRWYLPELRPEYDVGRDNLIIVDAGSERFLGQALDELSAFGCRYARLVLLTQEAFVASGKLASIRHHPVSHLLVLPNLSRGNTTEAISDFLLPFAVDAVGTAMAAAADEG